MQTLSGLLQTIHGLLNAVVPVIVMLGVVYFVWGVVQYVIADSEEAKKGGKDRIVYGIIGLAIIVSLWGLVSILVTTFGLQNSNAPLFTSGSGCNISSGIFNSVDVKTKKPSIESMAGYVNCFIRDAIIPFIFALAVATFVWGVIKFFIINADEEAKRTQGKQFMVWGLIALTVMLSVWGLTRILSSSLFGQDIISIPQTVEPPKKDK
mgnify:CR=1 FL=1